MTSIGKSGAAAGKKRKARRGLGPKHSQPKIGMPPGSLVHLGTRKVDAARLRLIEFDSVGLREEELSPDANWQEFKESPQLSWVNVDGLHDVDCVDNVGRSFGVHALSLEDLLNTGHRPKFEEFDQYILGILKMINWDAESGEVRTEQLSLVIGHGFLLTFQERPGDVFESVRERIRHNRGRIRKSGSDYLAFALMDAVVDNYMVVIERLGEELESIEEALEEGQPQPELLKRIHNLKREMIFVRRAVWPIREGIGSLSRGESPLVAESSHAFFRDLYDHTIQVIDTLESMRDMASSLQDLYLSLVSNRMNEVMQVLTIIATIFIPLTFVAGIYGMNFDVMPELHWTWGYPAVWVIMVSVVIGMVAFFRRRQWF